MAAVPPVAQVLRSALPPAPPVPAAELAPAAPAAPAVPEAVEPAGLELHAAARGGVMEPRRARASRRPISSGTAFLLMVFLAPSQGLVGGRHAGCDGRQRRLQL